MSIDLSKLHQDECDAATNAAFIALARNAFDVIVSRYWKYDWWGEKHEDDEDGNPTGGWRLDWESCLPVWSGLMAWNNKHAWPDPFTALVEADRWYKANVEATPAAGEGGEGT